MRASGLPVEAVVEGAPRPLSPGVDLSAYRIVQEALTNALRHAGGASARVVVRYDPDALELEIADDGPGPPGDPEASGGHGLIGMRERVQLFGGELEAGARPGGGSSSGRACPRSRRERRPDPGADRRRPGPDAHRFPHDPGRSGRHRGRGEVIDGADAIRRFEALSPDVVVMDVRMPTMDGIEATRRLAGSSGRLVC